MIHGKKNDLLYKDAICLCHSLARLWIHILVGLFLLALNLAPSSVLDAFSVLFRPSSPELLFLTVMFFLAFGGAVFSFGCFFLRLFLRPS